MALASGRKPSQCLISYKKTREKEKNEVIIHRFLFTPPAKFGITIISTTPFLNSYMYNSHFQNDANGKTFLKKVSLLAWKWNPFFITIALHWASSWQALGYLEIAHFSWVSHLSQDKLKTMLIQIFLVGKRDVLWAMWKCTWKRGWHSGVGTVDLASISELTSAPSFTSFLVHGAPLKIAPTDSSLHSNNLHTCCWLSIIASRYLIIASRKSFTRFFCGEKKSHLINLEKSKTNNDNNKTIHIRNAGNISRFKVSHRQAFKISFSKLLKNKLMAPREGTVNKVTFEWSHHGILSTNSKVRATLWK